MFRLRHTNRVSKGEVAALLLRISSADQVAFASLHARLRPRLLDRLAAVPLEPADVLAVANATFVEVWWLASRWPGRETDAVAWVFAIAARRGAERRSARRAHSTEGAEPDDIFTSLDRQVGMELDVLLAQPPSAGQAG
ncbi:hypothetical protein [Dactylosporangium sp. CA-139066]|uniref:hypothetical protein n=1 Tax=Dactylosporangium sp. CA-139066 TaxID=3239930 RepID=UPI003D8A4202